MIHVPFKVIVKVLIFYIHIHMKWKLVDIYIK